MRSSTEDEAWGFGVTGAWLERVAANFGVPIIPLEELREPALIYGEEYIDNG